MAKKKRKISTEFDWYLVSVDRLKKIGLILLVIAIGVGGYAYWSYGARDPKQRAEKAMSDAQQALNELAASRDFNAFRAEFDRGSKKLDEARAMFASHKFPEAESVAIESQTIATSALARLPGDRDSDAQFLTVEGDVQFQKSSNTDWKRAEPRTPLFNGDWVKTSDGASAELIFSNGSLYTIGPSALLEIYAVVSGAGAKKQNSVQMQVGSVEINTADDASAVQTPGSSVVVGSESTAQVGVDKQARSTAVVMKGSSTIAPKTGGAAVNVAPGEQVEATKEGTLSAVMKVVMPPALLSPADNQVYQATNETRVELSWGEQASASAYQLQVSRSRLFARLEIDARRTTPRATVKITSEGAFYWRVASVDATGKVGPFSTFRRFRVTGFGATASQTAESDKTPPSLQLKRPFNVGEQYYIIEGKAEPGATVFINDEEVGVESDGSFRKLVSFPKSGWNTVVVKAVDAAGNQTVQRENVHVEE